MGTIAAMVLLGLFGPPSSVQNGPYAQEIAAFKASDAKHPPRKGQILFIGSSSFTRWTSVGQSFPGREILNRAFGGSALTDLLARVDDVVTPYAPSQVVLYCGENDFAYDPSLDPETVVSRFKRVYRKIRARTRDAPFVYVSMKPSPSRWELAPKFKVANAAIRSFLARERGTAFVDVWPVMLGQDGTPRSELFVEDRLHVNQEGYRLWAPLLDRVLLKPSSRAPVPVADVPWWAGG